jgi:hypothetical protein
MRRAWMALALAAACARPDTAAKPPANARQQLIGTWRAVEYSRGPDNAREYPFGQPPRGYIVYDATGHVFFQVGSRGQQTPPPNKSWSQADSSTLEQLIRGSSAYFGTYTVDETNGTVTHRIEGEIPPWRATTEVAHPFTVRNDTLSIASWVFVRVH